MCGIWCLVSGVWRLGEGGDELEFVLANKESTASLGALTTKLETFSVDISRRWKRFIWAFTPRRQSRIDSHKNSPHLTHLLPILISSSSSRSPYHHHLLLLPPPPPPTPPSPSNSRPPIYYVHVGPPTLNISPTACILGLILLSSRSRCYQPDRLQFDSRSGRQYRYPLILGSQIWSLSPLQERV